MVRTVSDAPRVTALNAAPSPEGRWIVGVVGKRTYEVSGTTCRLAAEQVALAEKPIPGAAPFLLEHDSDLIVNRRLTDVVVKGHAYAASAAHGAEFEARVTVDRWSRAVRVFGDRRCEWRREGEVRFSPPDGIEKVPLDWPFAYGGVDSTALKKYGDPAQVVAKRANVPYLPFFGMFAYPRNPLGRGYVTESAREEIDGMTLPNLEEPGALLTPRTLVLGDFRRWPLAPMPAGFNWLPYAFFPRSSQAGFPMRPYLADQIRPEQFAEVALQAMTVAQIKAAPLPHNGHLGVVQGSAAGMRAGSVSPNAPIQITNMHPQWATWRFELRAPPPQMYLRFTDGKPVELAPRIRLLHIEPDRSRVSVVWVGEHEREIRPPAELLEKTQHAVVWRD